MDIIYFCREYYAGKADSWILIDSTPAYLV